MLDVKKVTINGNEYAVEPLNPHEAILWTNRVMPMLGHVLGRDSSGMGEPLETSKIMEEAVARCWTPEKEKLSDPEVYNRWFQKHPADLYLLGIEAAREVGRDFLPQWTVTMLETLKSVVAGKAAAE